MRRCNIRSFCGTILLMKKLPNSNFLPTQRRLSQVLNRSLQISVLVFASISLSVFADELADVNKSLKAGQYPDALSKADAFLVKHPTDASMRFIKGVILTEQGKSAEAIAIFVKLTEEHPELPEPYNNLAVLYAASGQYDKARVALDAAIRTNPTYATAYENLGDVHAKLASQAYDKALQLDSANANAKSKLTLLRSLAGTGANSRVAPIANSAAPATTPATASVAPVAVAAPTPATTKPAASAVVASAKPTVADTKPAAPVQQTAAASASKPAKPETKTETKEVAKLDEREDVLRAVHAWAKAWSTKDTKSYLNYYANDFQTPKGEPRKAWADERRLRIEGKGHIEVRVESPNVSINGSTATVKFRQVYKSDQLSADSRKTLILEKQGSNWQIKQEHAGS